MGQLWVCAWYPDMTWGKKFPVYEKKEEKKVKKKTVLEGEHLQEIQVI